MVGERSRTIEPLPFYFLKLNPLLTFKSTPSF